MAYGDSPAASLAAVRAAIAAVLLNQKYRIADRVFEKADLSQLRKMEKELAAQVNKASGARPGASSVNLSGYL